MLYSKSLCVIASAVLFNKVQATFNATSHSNIVYYWGQNSAGATGDVSLFQQPLGHYCDSEDSDIIVIAFLHQFGQGRSTAFDLANSSRDCKGSIPGTQLMDCPKMEEGIIKHLYDIKYCQSKSKKIILSLGGATPAYGVDSIKEGEELADELWDTFAGGKNRTIARPFGNATVDGFDLDIENGSKAGYTAFVNRMRKNYETDTSKTYYIAAAPQCPFPDYFVGDALNDAWFDFVMIQFYNNYCNVVNTATFNYDIWDSWAKTRSINKNVRLFVGIPGSPSAAGRGYVPYKQLMGTIQPLQSIESFGGIMVWDVSQAYGNVQDVLPNYAKGLTRLVKGTNDTSPIEYASSGSSSSSSSSSSSTSSNAQPTLMTVTSTSTTISTNTVTATDTLSSTTTTVCNNSIIHKTSYSVTELVVTTTLPNPASLSQFTESIYMTQSIVPYNVTVTAAACEASSSNSIINNSTSTLLGNHTEVPIEGQVCSNEGSLQCSGPASFAQCIYGKYVIRTCASSTVCRENYDTTPPSIYCGFP